MKDATRFALAIAAILAATALDAPKPDSSSPSVENAVDPALEAAGRGISADDRSRWMADRTIP